MNEPSYMYEDFKIWVLLNEVRHAIHDAAEKELRKFNISPAEASVLSILKARGGTVTPNKISQCLLRKPNSICELLGRMEKKGLVVKAKDMPRKNMVRVLMTEKGEQAYSNCIEISSVRRILSSLSDAQQRQIVSCLNILREVALNEIKNEREAPLPL